MSFLLRCPPRELNHDKKLLFQPYVGDPIFWGIAKSGMILHMVRVCGVRSWEYSRASRTSGQSPLRI
jgi:hypothetical protein